MKPRAVRRKSLRRGWVSLAALLLLAIAPPLRAEAPAEATADLVQTKCPACHRRLPDGSLNRIDQQRKTPEGWSMTLTRMERLHGLRLTEAERRALLKTLADTRGLAPQETLGFRYALERRPAVIETGHDEELMVVCARCHSYAQIALERRDAAEWRKLANFHLGQWPTAEYQSRGRDRNWWELASTKVPARLGELYPFSTAAWSAWRDRPHRDLSGTWRVVGHRPGRGDYEGRAEITRSGADEYRVKLSIRYASGAAASGEGSAVVYTGYEWRASLDLGGEEVRQVFALSEDGSELTGRWFLEDSDSLGADLRAVRVDAGPEVLSVEPPYLRAGAQTEVSVHGIGLSGEVNLGPDVEIVSRKATPETIVVTAQAAKNAEPGVREVAVGKAKASGLFAVVRRFDSLRVEPGYAIARVGGGGGKKPVVPVQFEAVAYLAGPDGKSGTADDVRVGVIPARWSVENFDAAAAAMQDAKFSGAVTKDGLFVPAAAGPNPKRRFGTNNAGDLRVRASAGGGAKPLSAEAHLVVTVQRWVDPPIR